VDLPALGLPRIAIRQGGSARVDGLRVGRSSRTDGGGLPARSGGCDVNVRSLRSADGEVHLTHADLDRVAQRGPAHDFDLRPWDKAQFHHAAHDDLISIEAHDEAGLAGSEPVQGSMRDAPGGRGCH
jgi:hypothetical protein